MDDEARQLTGSILIVIGFLLGAGAINFLSARSPLNSSPYFVGIIILLISLVFDYKAIRRESLYYDPDEVEETEYSKTVQKHITEIKDRAYKNKSVNEERKRLIRIAWIFLLPRTRNGNSIYNSFIHSFSQLITLS